MTELIKELALQAADEIADLFNPGFFDDRMVADVADINKKFALLILEEVMQTLIVTGHDAAADMLNNHFGFEE